MPPPVQRPFRRVRIRTRIHELCRPLQPASAPRVEPRSELPAVTTTPPMRIGRQDRSFDGPLGDQTPRGPPKADGTSTFRFAECTVLAGAVLEPKQMLPSRSKCYRHVRRDTSRSAKGGYFAPSRTKGILCTLWSALKARGARKLHKKLAWVDKKSEHHPSKDLSSFAARTWAGLIFFFQQWC